jgi:hypothetical protein
MACMERAWQDRNWSRQSLLHEVKEDLEQKGRRLVLRWIYYLEVDDFRHDLIQLSEPRGLWLRANSKVIAIAIAKLMVIAK